LLPNFIDEWINTADVARYFGAVNKDWVAASGQTKPEMIINIDSLAIIVLVIPISWLISRLHKVAAMIIGMVIALVGFLGSGLTFAGWVCCVMIFVFAIGEMICSPTFSAYIGLIAPRDKKALYMGYSNIPFAIGWALGNLLSGYMYEHMASKANLARDYLAHHAAVSAAQVSDAKAFPNDAVVGSLAYVLQTRDVQRLVSTIEAVAAQKPAAGDPAALDAYKPILSKVEPAGIEQTTRLLWDTYHPQYIWYYLGAIGLAGTLGMTMFYYATRRTLNGGTAATA